MLRYCVQRYSHSEGEFITMVQLVFFVHNRKFIRKVNKQII